MAMSVTSSIGVMIQVTLRTHGHIMGQETAFPLDATFLDWVSGLTGDMVRTPRRAAGTESTTAMSTQGI